MNSWVDFFRERRLRHMLRLVGDPGLSRMGDKLCDNLETLFEGAGEIRPSVLHGDLWSGNVGAWGLRCASGVGVQGVWVCGGGVRELASWSAELTVPCARLAKRSWRPALSLCH